MSSVSTHVLDLSAGQPVAGIQVSLAFRPDTLRPWQIVTCSQTDSEGRIRDLLPASHLFEAGLYCLKFDTSAVSVFFPEVSILFRVADPSRHYHVPLLLNAFGYSTYRGS